MNRRENSNPLSETMPKMCGRVHTKLVTGSGKGRDGRNRKEAQRNFICTKLFYSKMHFCPMYKDNFKYNFTTVKIQRSHNYIMLIRSLPCASTVLNSLYVLIFSVTIFDTIIISMESEAQRLNSIPKITELVSRGAWIWTLPNLLISIQYSLWCYDRVIKVVNEMLRTILNTPTCVTHVAFSFTLLMKHYHYPNFADEETLNSQTKVTQLISSQRQVLNTWTYALSTWAHSNLIPAIF